MSKFVVRSPTWGQGMHRGTTGSRNLRQTLEPSEWVMVAGAFAASAWLAFRAFWVPGFALSLFSFLLIGAGPEILRRLSNTFPRQGFFDFVRSFWLVPAMVLGHGAMKPIADSAKPVLLDAALAQWDLRLFSQNPSVWLEGKVPGLVTELLLICYYSYYLWPLLLGGFLNARARPEVYNRFRLAVVLFFLMNFIGYAMVPAVGPRFYLAHAYQSPLQGVWLTPWLESAMRQPAFLRDCFPSGHTGLTLVVLSFAWQHGRRLFWLILPGALGLVAATVVGRFHYVVDLLGAVPMAAVAMALASFWENRGRNPARANVPSNGALY